MILTLCGSARFEPYWHEANKLLGLAGHICFGLMTYPSIEGSKSWYTEDQKWTLDLAHFAKIEESDGVVMLNIDGYLGESSLRELKWARMRDKQVYWTCRGEHRRKLEPCAVQLVNPEVLYRPIWTELLDAVKAKQNE